MSRAPITIPKLPVVTPAEDYYSLRSEGVGFIEQTGSHFWTDYNNHDPGITILEALCYAITDLGYRIDWDIADLLAPASPPADLSRPFPNQPFFTAREILTVNPWTPDDFRRLLIDLEKVRNAWIFCKQCVCDTSYYAWCENDALTLSYLPPVNRKLQPKTVEPLGLYEVLLELEADPESGDLNDRKIEFVYQLRDANGSHAATLELRFPELKLADREQWVLFLGSDDAFAGLNGQAFTLKLTRFGATKTYDLFSDPTLDEAGRNDYLRSNWRTIFYLSFEIELTPGAQMITIENAALRLIGSADTKNAVTAAGLKALFEDAGVNGFIQRYRRKELLKAAAIALAKAALLSHRNLDEDFCRVKEIGIEEVAACADVEVTPDADIERVQAQIWFELEQYFNPPVPFYTLQELLDEGQPVEEIFNGPELQSGFIKSDDLENAQLQAVICVSDLINRLMDIDGVIAVNRLQLTKYDSEGNVISGAADPTWSSDGNPIFDPNRTSASWLLYISKQHQARLYLNASRFLFYKNSLPLLPRMDEAQDTLIQLQGEAERAKISSAPNDLPIPGGKYRNPDDYFPVQYSFPLTYGIGPDGLPSNASAQRRAQAKQLKAYLMVFEQILGNAFAQIAHAADLFSLDPGVRQTYFVMQFSEQIIKGYSEIVQSGLNLATLEAMLETETEFQQRRNRFLDHILARFGEEFREYALLLTNLQGQKVALSELINDKISFLAAYPLVSHDRSRAFNYSLLPCAEGNQPGIKKRVSLLLGYPDLFFHWQLLASSGGTGFQQSFVLQDRLAFVWFQATAISGLDPLLTAFLATLTPKVAPDSYQIDYLSARFQLRLKDQNGNLLEELSLEPTVNAATRALSDALENAFRVLLVRMILPDAYQIVADSGKSRLQLIDSANAVLGSYPERFDGQEQAASVRDRLLAWSANERMIVLEHLLLRPKFPGDALYPACSQVACATCGDEDPYSFRLTFVMPGWTAPFNTDMDMRGFAERTIRQEIPSHLVAKICWVGNDGFVENPCDPVIVELARLLATKGLTAGGVGPAQNEACDCAAAIYQAFSQAFSDWYQDKLLQHIPPDPLLTELEAQFGAKVKPEAITCTTLLIPALWTEVMAVMVAHFQQIALYGWQFERLETAWCQWLDLNATFDWTEERLQERVQAIMQANLVAVSGARRFQNDPVCLCATAVLNSYGMQFYSWMSQAFNAGNFDGNAALPSFTIDMTTSCPSLSFRAGTADLVRTLLENRYNAYKEVSYRLRVVVSLLARLSNTYPAATLYDCDQGNDKNPVRLGTTALGS
jgi:hypothetical protein